MKKDKVVIIDQARMKSSRLPGKILRAALGKPLLEHQIFRLRRVLSADELVIATTVNDSDEPIVKLCRDLGVKFYRGPEDDVLARYYEAAKASNADVVIRVTSDCPLIDPEGIESLIAFYLANKERYDYATNRSDEFLGLCSEIFSFRVLKEAHERASATPDREHVTPYLYHRPDVYRIAQVPYLEGLGRHRWTVDTEEDFRFVDRVFTKLYPVKNNFSLSDILALVKRHPELERINAHIKQKVYGE